MEIVRRENGVAALTPYLVDRQSAGAVLICPGGAYGWISPREGKPVADAFNRSGYHAFVLEYTVVGEEPPPDAEPLGTKPLADAAWAIAHIREHAAEYRLDPDKIAVCGFSAGGHLAASLGVYWNRPDFFGGGKAPEAYRPNALILCYAVLSGGSFRNVKSFSNLAGESLRERAPYSMENQISPAVPPTFLWHTSEDEGVPVQNSLLFAMKLAEYGIPHELHVFPHGVHGLSLATPEVVEAEKGRYPDPHVARWMELCIEWLTETFT